MFHVEQYGRGEAETGGQGGVVRLIAALQPIVRTCNMLQLQHLCAIEPGRPRLRGKLTGTV
jgi:hypothetical protein